ncbi:MAG: efflux RND transporter periplasmic adaptor subunit [Desulfatitalea sp.]
MENSNTSPGATNHQSLGLDAGDGRRPLWRRWLKWILLVLVALIAVFIGLRGSRKAAVEYKTAAVTRGDLIVNVTATGNLVPTNEVTVGSELSGIIKTVTVDYNDLVKVGQPLAYLDNTKFEAAVMQSRAALISARAKQKQAYATLRQKQQNLERMRKVHDLSGGRAPSAGELEGAEADLLRAEADEAAAQGAIAQALATLKIDETNLSKSIIYSPINGIVLARNVDPGQTVAASLQAPVLFSLAEDLTKMELQVDVDEADVGWLRQGQSATFSVDAYPDRTFEANIIQVRYGSQINNGVVTYTALLNVDNRDLVLRPGMTATAEIVVDKIENALLVPNAALRFAPRPNGSPAAPKRGLVDMLTIRPPQRGTKTASKTNDAKSKTQQIWILKDQQPVALTVTTGPSNGSHTVIKSEEVQPDMLVIVDTVASKESLN